MNITFDLETLGKNNAPIAQIAAVAFTDEGKIVDRLESMRVDLEDLSNYDFELDYSTINWWMEQSDDAIKSVFVRGMGWKLTDALKSLSDFIIKNDDGSLSVWSHATFDPPILNNAYNKCNLPNPIHFRWHRDIRTLTLLSGVVKTKVEGIEHNAMDDCLNQAKYISQGLMALKK